MSRPADHSSSASTARGGLIYALLAFGWWAVVFPILVVTLNHRVQQMGHFDTGGATRADWSLEFMTHRAIWSTVTCLVLLAALSRMGEVRQLLSSRRSKLLLGMTALLMLGNWTGFVYGAATDRLSHASLGYYINPLLSVALAIVVLGERLRRVQVLAVVLATIGVAWETWRLGQLPWISLLVAFSFGLYGLFRKQIRAAAIPGLFVEGLWMLPLGAGYLCYREVAGPPPAFGRDWMVSLLLVLSGVATAAPLIWFASAAKRLPLSTVAFMQFIVPTGQLLIAVTLNNESLTLAGLVSFAFIWLGVVAFLVDIRLVTRKEPEPANGGAIMECQ